jgi:arginyl-tRNA synthetase
VEFISANPTGPLTLGNGRGGFCGDVLANILIKAGYKTKREYYINNTGEQIKKLGHSVIGDKEAVYQGEYINALRKEISGQDPEKVGEKAAAVILKRMIEPAVKKMRLEFDVWFSEKKLNKETGKALEFLKKSGLTYEAEGALWFKSTQFGDDKDRVLVKAGGERTYLASDIAYLKNKFGRKFQKLIFFWGADHHGYIGRIKAAAEALGYKKEQIEIIICQLVRLMKDGQEVKMSKRSGIYVTIDELIDEVGLDVARFFFLSRAADSHLNFDLALAKDQSEKNPVYYIQYAYARICSILAKSGIKNPNSKNDLGLLCHPSELRLIKQLIRFPEIVEDTAKDYQIQRLPQYALDLATVFHQFYRDCQVLSDNLHLARARLSLASATRIVLKNTLSLMGISAPEKM